MLWLSARRRGREQRAEVLEMAVLQMENAAALSGRKVDLAAHFGPLRASIERLRSPEWIPEVEPSWKFMSEREALIMYGKTRLDAMKAEDAARQAVARERGEPAPHNW